MFRFKVFVFLFVFMPVLFLAGCGSGESESVESVDEFITTKYSGVLKPLGVKINQNATHMLELTGGEIVYVYSNFYNLSSQKFLNKIVEVRGTLIPGEEGEKDMMEIETLLVLDEEEPPMEIFSSIELGFSIEYPTDFEVQKGDNLISFVAEKNAPADIYEQRVEVIQTPAEENLNLEQFLTDNGNAAERIVPSIFGKDKSLSGYKYVSEDSSKVIFVTVSGDFVYQAVHTSANPQTLEKYRTIFFKMVDTLELTSVEKLEEDDDQEKKEDEEPEEDQIGDKKEITETESGQSEREIEEEDESDEDEKSEEDQPEDRESKDEQTSVINYVSSNISSLAPEQSAAGRYSVSVFEFVNNDYVYVEYSDNEVQRKLLLSYDYAGGQTSNVKMVGYFVAGEQKDWDLKEGTNPTSGASKEIVNVDSAGGVEESFSVAEGFRYFESGAYHFKAQYPASWYYSGSSGLYKFGKEPVTDDNNLITMEVMSAASLDDVQGNSTSAGGKTIKTTVEDGVYSVYVDREKGGIFKIITSEDYKDVVLTMAQGIIEN